MVAEALKAFYDSGDLRLISSSIEVPDEELKDTVNRLRQLLQTCPSDSFLRGIVERKEGSFSVRITVKSLFRRFDSSNTHSEYPRALKSSVDDIYNQLKLWRKERFQPEDTPQRRKPNILIVDDDQDSIVPLSNMLKEMGCTTAAVSNGFEAIHRVTTHPEDYDLVVLDLSMPDIDGQQTVLGMDKVVSNSSELKSKWKIGGMPLVTYSARKKEEFELPETQYFNYVDHWCKVYPSKDIQGKAETVVKKLSNQLH